MPPAHGLWHTRNTEDIVNMTVSSTEEMQARKGLPGLHLHYIAKARHQRRRLGHLRVPLMISPKSP